MGANTLHLKGGEALTAPIQTARFVCKAEHVRELTDTMSHITRLLLCKQAAKIFQTICKKETALKRVLRNLLSAISFAQI